MRRAITALMLFVLLGAVPMAALPAARAAQDSSTGDDAEAATSSLPSVRWTFQGDEPNLEEAGDPLHAGEDGVVYVDGRNQRLHALDARTGATRWRANARGDFLTAAGGTVYVSRRNEGPQRLTALDAATGTERWRWQSSGPISTSELATDDEAIYVTDLSPEGAYVLIAFAAATGDERWRIEFPAGNVQFSEPAITNGLLLVSVDGSPDDPIRLYAFDVASGEVRWQHGSDGPFQGTWVEIVDDTAFAHFQSTGERPGELRALDAATGEERWRRTTAADGDVFSPVAIAGGAVLVTDVEGERGNVYALDPATGEERWRAETGAMGSYRLPADDEAVYVADQTGGFYTLDVATGRELGRFFGPGEFRPPLVAGDSVYVPDIHGRLFAFAEGGVAPRWQAQIATPAALTEAGGTVYAQSIRYLEAIDAATGRLLWRIRTGFSFICIEPEAPLMDGEAVFVGGPEGDVLALEPPARQGSDGPAPVYTVEGDQLVDIGLDAVPAAPAFVGMWRLVLEPGAGLDDNPFSAGAGVFLVESGILRVETPVSVDTASIEVVSGDMVAGDRFVVPHWAGFAGRNERDVPVEMLVGAVVPSEALPSLAGVDGVTLQLLAGGEADVLPSADAERFQTATVTLDRYLLEPGGRLAPTLSLLPDVLLLDGTPGQDDTTELELTVAVGAIQVGIDPARTAEEGESATLRPGEGALLPAGSLALGRLSSHSPTTVTVMRLGLSYIGCGSGCAGRCLGGRF